MQNIPWDRISPEFIASIVMFGVLVGFAKWMIGEYFKLTGKVLEAMVRSTSAMEKLTVVVQTCLKRLEGGANV